jgi:hypothetical protein
MMALIRFWVLMFAGLDVVEVVEGLESLYTFKGWT